MSGPIVVMHRPPRPRIDFTPVWPKAVHGTDSDQFSYSPVHCDRVWALVRQCAEGTNPAGGAE